MSEMQLKLIIGNVEINLQGEGALVHTILNELRNEGLGQLALFRDKKTSAEFNFDNEEDDNLPKTSDPTAAEDTQAKQKNRKKRNVSVKPQLIKELDLRGTDEKTSLRNFFMEKQPSTNIQRTTVFVYYLQYKLNIPNITIDHVFTCYKEMGIREPENLVQNISDTASSRYGYIDRQGGKLTMSVKGRNFVEHDLPEKEGK
ncbi:MAG: hypothetical protein QHH06_10210 [Clostridiales bacterium]|jgi:hypothetical protein|nr:hypothetical protein [Eubacteriales bacterium]MDH7566838.1 hypothetical protein [Clostridiales bacterium]